MANVMRHSTHRIWRNASFRDIELQQGSFVRHHRVNDHFHESYQFVLVEDGGRYFRYRHCKEDVGCGKLTLVQPGEVHSGTCSPDLGSSFLTLHLPSKYVTELEPNLTRDLENLPFSIGDEAVRNCFKVLHASLEDRLDRAELDELILKLIGSICRFSIGKTTRAAPPKQRIERTRTYIQEHYQEICSLEQLAELSCLSKYHFIREFAKAYGTSPIVYRNAIRVSEARKLLADGTPPITVATELGFADQSHFGRVFRTHVGFTPAAYQKISAA
jgi:AraC-like DNA-binding protein